MTQLRFLLFTLLLLMLASLVQSDEEAKVDKADSLDFEGFHEDDQGGTTIDFGGMFGGTKRQRGVNVFNRELDNPSGKGSVAVEDIGTPGSGTTRRSSPYNSDPGVPPTEGEVMNIRVRYALTGSDKTPFLANTATVALHNYIVEHCANGWVKLAEWSLPIESDYYLYYQFQCVPN